MSHRFEESTENGYSPPFYQHEMFFDSRHPTGLLQCLGHVCGHQAMSLCISPLWNATESKLFFPCFIKSYSIRDIIFGDQFYLMKCSAQVPEILHKLNSYNASPGAEALQHRSNTSPLHSQSPYQNMKLYPCQQRDKTLRHLKSALIHTTFTYLCLPRLHIHFSCHFPIVLYI